MKSFYFLAVFVVVVQSTVAQESVEQESVEQPSIPEVTIPDQLKVEKKWKTLDGDEITGSLVDANYKIVQINTVRGGLFVDGKNYDILPANTQQFVLDFVKKEDRRALVLALRNDGGFYQDLYFAIAIKETSGNVKEVPVGMIVLPDEEQAAMVSLQKSVDNRIAALKRHQELMQALAAAENAENAANRAENAANRDAAAAKDAAVSSSKSSTQAARGYGGQSLSDSTKPQLKTFTVSVSIYRKSGGSSRTFQDQATARNESEARKIIYDRHRYGISADAIKGVILGGMREMK